MHTTAPTAPRADSSAGRRLATLSGYLAQDPGNAALRADTFDAAMQAGELDRADELLRPLPPDLRAAAPWCLCEFALRMAQKRYEAARGLMDRLMTGATADPALASVITQNLAQVDFAEGQVQACIERLNALMADTSLPASTQQLWLRCLHRQARLADACEWALRAEQAGRLAPPAAAVAALAAIDHARLNLAQRWAAFAEAAGGAGVIEFRVVRATLALADQDGEAGLRWANEALAMNPRDGRAWSMAGMAAMLAGDFSGAEDAFSRAVERLPEHLASWQGLGWARLFLGNLAAARDAFERALELDRNFAENHGALAVIEAMAGDVAAARRHADVARRLDPEGLAGRYAEAILNGEAGDAKALGRLARRVLGGRWGRWE